MANHGKERIKNLWKKIMNGGRYIILGDGLLGSELIRQTGWDYVSRKKDGLYFNNIVDIENRIYQYDQIINCIAYTNTYDKKREPAWTTNFVSVLNLVDSLNRVGKKFIHVSTDYIYANSVSFATEESVPSNATNWYSYTKLLADGYIQARCKDYLLIRTSFKPRPFPYHKGLINQVGNFDYVDVIANKIVQLIKNNAFGVYNVGTSMKTQYDLGLQTNPDIEPVDMMIDESMPRDVTMNISKMTEFLEKHNDKN